LLLVVASTVVAVVNYRRSSAFSWEPEVVGVVGFEPMRHVTIQLLK
jgi:hypothetical protein